MGLYLYFLSYFLDLRFVLSFSIFNLFNSYGVVGSRAIFYSERRALLGVMHMQRLQRWGWAIFVSVGLKPYAMILRPFIRRVKTLRWGITPFQDYSPHFQFSAFSFQLFLPYAMILRPFR